MSACVCMCVYVFVHVFTYMHWVYVMLLCCLCVCVCLESSPCVIPLPAHPLPLSSIQAYLNVTNQIITSEVPIDVRKGYRPSLLWLTRLSVCRYLKLDSPWSTIVDLSFGPFWQCSSLQSGQQALDMLGLIKCRQSNYTSNMIRISKPYNMPSATESLYVVASGVCN